MKIRTITSLYNPILANAPKTLEKLASFTQEAQKAFTKDGIEVQTTRLSTNPFSKMVDRPDLDEVITFAQSMEEKAKAFNFQYLSIGPALPDKPSFYEFIPEILKHTEIVFLSAVAADASVGVDLKAVRACARIIHTTAPITPDGFTNLRFTVLANVKPFGPFFPSSYNQGNQPGFSIAVESADLAVQAVQEAGSIMEAQENLKQSLENNAAKISKTAEALADKYNLSFHGIDFSYAPFPEDQCSLGKAIENFGVSIGKTGSIAAAALLAESFDRGSWKKAGFNGLMLPLLEDSILAKRSIEDTLSIKDLILYSTVCGTGLDTIPVPGDVSIEELEAVILDIAALSMRLNKQLTARLMPVPGKKAGEITEFDFAFFRNGKVIPIDAQPLKGLLSGDEQYQLVTKQNGYS
ncbi:MAG: DUF711 family protein [Anaerolineaceae bacterium]|nr:DUF711 family protein [Anaerolineaceae bacterium]